MNTELIEKRLELLESRQQWLFENTELSRMLFEHGITMEQNRKINDLLQSFRDKIAMGIKISSSDYETELLKIVKNTDVPTDYHFAESYLQLCYEDGRWEEVFETLYKDSIKFEHLFKNK